MVEVDFSGNFTNPENCKAGDIGTFLDEGKLEDKTFNGRTWKQLSISVEINQKRLTHSFKSAEGRRFQDKHGKDTKNWIGKQFKVVYVPYINKEKALSNAVEIVPLEEKV